MPNCDDTPVPAPVTRGRTVTRQLLGIEQSRRSESPEQAAQFSLQASNTPSSPVIVILVRRASGNSADTKGDRMAEVLRTQAPPINQDSRSPSEIPTAPGQVPQPPVTTALPEHSATTPALSRSAEAVGRGVGTAVAGVRQLKSRLQVVGGREGRGGVAAVKDAAANKAAELREAAETRVSELTNTASAYGVELTEAASNRLQELRSNLSRKVSDVRTTARVRLAQAREWQPEQPLRVILTVAAAAFALGVVLRLWRSSYE